MHKFYPCENLQLEMNDEKGEECNHDFRVVVRVIGARLPAKSASKSQ